MQWHWWQYMAIGRQVVANALGCTHHNACVVCFEVPRRTNQVVGNFDSLRNVGRIAALLEG